MKRIQAFILVFIFYGTAIKAQYKQPLVDDTKAFMDTNLSASDGHDAITATEASRPKAESLPNSESQAPTTLPTTRSLNKKHRLRNILIVTGVVIGLAFVIAIGSK